MNKMKKYLSLILVLALWLSLTAFAWFKPANAFSDSERRHLAQFPELSVETLLSGKFMSKFADYAVDQFPLRDGWRGLNAMLSLALGQKDNNGLYLHDGYIVKMDYPMNEEMVNFAADRFDDLYNMYLTENENVFFAIVPDKGYYLAEEAGALAPDYEKLFSMLEGRFDWAQFIDLTGVLSADSYYHTDTHWRQEKLIPVAQVLGDAMGVPVRTEYEIEKAWWDFKGVYYGQAALPLKGEDLNWLVWPGMEDVVVYSHDSGTQVPLYNKDKLLSRDPYESYLSGNMALLTVTNPNAQTDERLIVFRDSFGSSIVPLLIDSYAEITLVDTRYMNPGMVGQFVDFEGADVLMIYSTLVMNSSSALRK